MFIIMLGGPGTGKGSIGGKLSEDYNLTHIATGDMFREEIKKQTKLGKKMQKYMSKGKLVPDKVVIEIIKKRLSEPDSQNGVILDGFPRTKKQAEVLDKLLEKANKKVDVAIEINISDENIIKRIVNRQMCSNKTCGAIYNTEFSPSKIAGKCDKCGSELIKRDDDNEKTVKQRLKVYHEISKELLAFYKKTGVLYTLYPNIYSPTVLEENISEINKYLKNKNK